MTKRITASARKWFLGEAKQVDGVRAILHECEDTSGEEVILVYVDSLFSEVAKAIFRLNTQRLQRFEGSNIEVTVEGLRELGLTESQFAIWKGQAPEVVF